MTTTGRLEGLGRLFQEPRARTQRQQEQQQTDRFTQIVVGGRPGGGRRRFFLFGLFYAVLLVIGKLFVGVFAPGIVSLWSPPEPQSRNALTPDFSPLPMPAPIEIQQPQPQELNYDVQPQVRRRPPRTWLMTLSSFWDGVLDSVGATYYANPAYGLGLTQEDLNRVGMTHEEFNRFYNSNPMIFAPTTTREEFHRYYNAYNANPMNFAPTPPPPTPSTFTEGRREREPIRR